MCRVCVSNRWKGRHLLVAVELGVDDGDVVVGRSVRGVDPDGRQVFGHSFKPRSIANTLRKSVATSKYLLPSFVYSNIGNLHLFINIYLIIINCLLSEGIDFINNN